MEIEATQKATKIRRCLSGIGHDVKLFAERQMKPEGEKQGRSRGVQYDIKRHDRRKNDSCIRACFREDPRFAYFVHENEGIKNAYNNLHLPQS